MAARISPTQLMKGTIPVITEHHDFGRPWAKHRKQTYLAMTILCMFICGVPFVAVLAGWWDAEPVGTIAAALVCIPIIVPMVAAWWDAPGENRTTLEKAYEFMLVWFPISAASQVLWESTWLIGDLLGYMNLGPEDRWGWFWYFYGAADTRFIKSDPGLWGMEFVAVIGGLILTWQHFKMFGEARHDDRKRITSLWFVFFSFSMMLAVIIIYWVSETRNGFAGVEQGFWGFWLKFIFMNLPWLFAPVISLPFIVKMQAYLYRKTTLDELQAQQSGDDHQAVATAAKA